jgi:hypothetical protein
VSNIRAAYAAHGGFPPQQNCVYPLEKFRFPCCLNIAELPAFYKRPAYAASSSGLLLR